MQKQPKKLLAAVEDLFFTVKIGEAAKRAGLDVEFVKNDKDLLAKAREEKPALIIFDLNFSDMQPLKVIGKLKSSAESKSISLIGYLSHVQGELKQKAHEAGCDMVLARSALSQNLEQILKRHSGTL
jgi:PleD family two-component response regulator